MRRILLTLAALTAITSCASTSTPGASSSPATSSPTASPTIAAACGTAPARLAGELTLTANDSGKRYCVTTGTTILVLLQGTPTNKWAPIRNSSSVLQPKPDGRFTLRVGETGAVFDAVRPGTATITSSRYPCGPTPHPPKVQCGVVIGYRVDLLIVS
jgi:hypothetical protein